MDDVMQLVELLPHPASALKDKKWLADLRTRTVQVINYWLLSSTPLLVFTFTFTLFLF